MSEKTITESIYALGRKVLAKFNLTEAGKVDNFISKIVKNFKSQLKAIETNVTIKKANHESSVDRLKEMIEDAEQGVIDAEVCMPLDKLQTNSDQSDYLTVYLENLDKAECKFESLKNQLSELEKNHKAELEDLEEQAKLYKARIDKFEKK
jgi:translation elongation factor EF-1beta